MTGRLLRKLLPAAAALLALTTAPATPFVAAQAPAVAVQTPEQFFGFRIGDDNKLARWDKIVDYFRQVSDASDRIRFRELHAGDRLPWVPIKQGEDTFVPLASVDWQVHLYGEARAGLVEDCAVLRLPLHVFPWMPAMESAGLDRGALYLIRPDGYVALADPESSPERLRQYLDQHNITRP